MSRPTGITLFCLRLAVLLLLSSLPMPQATAQAPNNVERVRALIVTISPTGFDPPSAVVEDRKVMLIIRNSDLDAHDLSIDRLGPNDIPSGQLKHEKSAKNAKRVVTMLELQPGKYRLTEIGTERVFVLTVR